MSETSGRLFITGECDYSFALIAFMIYFFFSESFSNLPPRISDSKPIIQGEEGSTVELSCAAQGYPIPTVKWTKNNIPLINTIDGRMNSDKNTLNFKDFEN